MGPIDQKLPSRLNFQVEVGGKKPEVRVNDYIDTYNEAVRLGITRKGGLTKDDVARLFHATNNQGAKNGSKAIWNYFDEFDKNNNGRLDSGDVEGILTDNEGTFHPGRALLSQFKGDAVKLGKEYIGALEK